MDFAAKNKPTREKPLVFVSGCYDPLHSGHVAFFKEASSYGNLFVSVGSDANIRALKKHDAMFPEEERLYMVKAIKYVYDGQVCSGSGMLDFEADLDVLKPDIFVVNEDGDRDSKRDACSKRGIKYIVCERKPDAGLSTRSSTAIKMMIAEKAMEKKSEVLKEYSILDRELQCFPWRICLTGGWLDQPEFSRIAAGGVIVVNIKPHSAFKTRSGLATSTRSVGIELWGTKDGGRPPAKCDNIELAKRLFGAENPPGSTYISGSQDALGLMLPGISFLDYHGGYWPENIKSIVNEEVVQWFQNVLWIVPLPSRPPGYDPLAINHASEKNVTKLANSSEHAWKALLSMDAPALGKAFRETLDAWAEMLPNTVPKPDADEWTAPYAHTHGFNFSGAGGGFLLVISDTPVKRGFQIEVNTKSFWG